MFLSLFISDAKVLKNFHLYKLLTGFNAKKCPQAFLLMGGLTSGIKKGEPFDSPFNCSYSSSPFVDQSISSSMEAM